VKLEEKGTLEDLERKNEALENKVRKFIAHSEHLEKNCRALKEENKVITQLRNELQKVNRELERVNREFEKSQQINVQTNDIDETLKIQSEELAVIKSKYSKQKDLNKTLKERCEELEYDKNRQISYLETENLQYLGEIKAAKKEIKALKAQRHMMSAGVDDAPTEDLGSIISMKLLAEKNKVDDNDKENHPNQSKVRASKSTTIAASPMGLGAGVGNDDDDPGECKQS